MDVIRSPSITHVGLGSKSGGKDEAGDALRFLLAEEFTFGERRPYAFLAFEFLVFMI